MTIIDCKSMVDNRLLFIIRNWSHKLVVPEIYWKPHIEFGYRQPYLKTSKIFSSLFAIHNDTMNIWTHLIGFFFAIYISCYYLIENVQKDISNYTMSVVDNNNQQLQSNNGSQKYKTMEIICFSAFTFSACSCLLFSTIFHWFSCLSPNHFASLLKLDHLGIALTIGSSYFPGVYFGFYCHPELQSIYLGMSAIVFTLSLITPWVSFRVGSMSAQTFTFLSLVVCGLAPTIHWCIVSPAFYRDQVVWGEFIIRIIIDTMIFLYHITLFSVL